MSWLAPKVAREIGNNEYLNDKWPVGAESVRQYGNYTLTFDEAVWPYVGYRSNELEYSEDIEDVGGLPWLGNYGGEDGDSLTKAEYEEWVAVNVPQGMSLASFFEKSDREAAAKIAELNEQVGKLVDQMVAIADATGLPFSVNLGARGSLDLDGPWDSSSAYC